MSEPIATEITIGGRIREDQVAGLCRAITDDGLSLEWGDACFTPETADDLLAGCQDVDGVRLLWLCDDQANYGCFDILEKYLESQRIAYRHKSEAKYEFDALIIEYRPQIGQMYFATDSTGQPLIPLAMMTSLAAAIDKVTDTAEGQTALELLRQLRNIQQLIHDNLPTTVPPLAAFEIAGSIQPKET